MKAIFKHLDIQLVDKKEEGTIVTLLVINNPDGSPRWICNAKSKEPLFLKFYLIESMKSQLIALTIKAIFFLGLQKVIFKTIKTNFKILKEDSAPIINISKDNWALFTGTVGPNNKILIYKKGKNKSSFYKIANSEKALSLIKKEEKAINELEAIKPITFTFPKADRIRRKILKLEDISLFGTRTTRFGHLHQLVLDEMYTKTSKSIEANALPIFNSCLLKLHRLEECNDMRIPKGMLKKLRIMLDAMRHKTIAVGFSHGDFTPWNMYVKNEKLAIYDWELATSLMPIGYDAFHYIIQQGVLVDKKPWKSIIKEIKSKVTQEQFLQWPRYGSLNIEEYLGFYLVINAISCLALFADQSKWHTQVHWLLNTWNEALSECAKEIKPQRGLMIWDLFDFFNEKEYAAIKFPEVAPDKLSEFSDIDLCVKRKDVKPILNYLKHHPLTAHMNTYRKSFMVNVQVFLEDGSFLSIDFIWQFKRKSLTMLNAERIIQKAYRNTFSIKQMGLLDKVRYIGLFHGLNNASIPLEYKVYEQILTKEESRLDEILYCNYLDDTILKRDLINCLKKEKENKYLSKALNILNYCLDSLRQFFCSKGMVITFSGVDGSGKSTVIDSIKRSIEKKMRKRVIVLRHRPSLLPILSAWVKGKKRARQDSMASLPRQGKNSSRLGSLLRFFYYYVDYLFGQFYVYFKYVCRGYVVIYDRYYFDFINDGRRSNIKLSKKLVKAGYTFLMKPDLNFFLYAKPKIILRRKQELDAPAIKMLTKRYLSLFKELNSTSKKQYFSIENNELSQTLGFVMKETSHKLGYIS